MERSTTSAPLARALSFASALALVATATAAVGCGTDDSGDPAGTTVAPGGSGDHGGTGGAPSSGGNGATGGGAGATGPTASPFPATPKETWTFVDVPGARCADGSGTGVGVNVTDRSDDVLVFLEGGGACWDGASCYGGQSIATYLTGYGQTEFDTDPQRALFATSRDGSNPFRDMNMVYVPYCTGDVHAGDKISNYAYLGVDHPTYQVGGRNLDLILAQAAASFPHAKRVWIAGDSAGGFGAALSVPRARKAFPDAALGILDDSGQPVAPTPGRWAAWRAAWNLAIPAGCAGCDANPAAYIPYYKASYGDVTFALLSYEPDPVISAFMGITLTDFATELDGTLSAIDLGGGKAKYYVALGASHVVLSAPTPALSAWLQAAVDGSPSWKSTRP